MIRYHIIASGRVQGVGFRFFVYHEAMKQGVTGWVRNLYDGTVEMELQGFPGAISEVLYKINRGNYVIDVQNLDIREISIVEGEKGFRLDYL